MHRFAPALLLVVAACGRTPDAADDLNRLDRELTAANATDPAIADALAGQIMVDPGLQQQSNANALRPPPRPDPGAVPADVPLPDPVDPRTLRQAPAAKAACPQCSARTDSYTLGALAAAQPKGAACSSVSYGAAWATRLPVGLPLYPDARVVEAAGSDRPCALRIVTFRSSAAAAKMINWYYTRATTAGYSAEHQAGQGIDVLGGTRGGTAYVVYVTPKQGGSEVDLLTTTGG